jgi:hypothetical protein
MTRGYDSIPWDWTNSTHNTDSARRDRVESKVDEILVGLSRKLLPESGCIRPYNGCESIRISWHFVRDDLTEIPYDAGTRF